MAFNPFVNFRKYQKFWMASILLLCMVTFVLCTGARGDLSEFLLRIFARRHGSPIAQLNDRDVYEEDLRALRDQRKAANDYMRLSAERVLKRTHIYLQESELKNFSPAERAEYKVYLTRIKNDLEMQLLKPRYFEGGIKAQDLLDFMMWLKVADRLEINLPEESVRSMADKEVFATLGRIPLLSFQDYLQVYAELRSRVSRDLTESGLWRALGNEFRVAIAKETCYLARYRPSLAVFYGIDPNKRNEILKDFGFLKLKYDPFFQEMTRSPLTPTQLWEFYKEKRTSYDLALIPVNVEEFLAKVGDPKISDLQSLFEKYSKEPYDPTSPKPGFRTLQKVKVEWLTADPKNYQNVARAVTTLEITPALTYSPFYSPLAAAWDLGVRPRAWKASMAVNYSFLQKQVREKQKKGLEPPPHLNYQAAPLTADALPTMVSYLERTDKVPPTAVAAAVGNGAQLNPFSSNFQYRANIFQENRKLLEEVLAGENRSRVHLAAALVGTGTNPFFSPEFLVGFTTRVEVENRFLPLDLIEKEFQEKREKKMADEWAIDNMIKVKEELENWTEKELPFRRVVPELVKKYNLFHGRTQNFYDRYAVEKAPELEEFRKAFEKVRLRINISEGRDKTSGELKEGDFFRLFFDDGLHFSAAGPSYRPRPWPPVVEVKDKKALLRNPNASLKKESFFNRGFITSPIVFWKTEDKASDYPKNLNQGDVKARVLAAWKTIQAREKYALPLAETIAKELENKAANGEYMPVFRAWAKKRGKELIIIRDVAPLQEMFDEKGQRHYRDYTLPRTIKDKFIYPRDDLSKKILAMTTLEKAEKALEFDYPELDKVNKDLFEIGKKDKERLGKQVQILTNKPHTVFYVGVVVNAPGPRMEDFILAFRNGATFRDDFVGLAQVETGIAFRKALVEQFRLEMGQKITDQKAVSSFDTTSD